MSWRLPLSDVVFDEAELGAVRAVMESGWISMGPQTELFESAFASYICAGNAVALSSGTAALHLALLALGIGPDDEVVLPSLTFVAAANVVRCVGADPVFADITSLDDLNVSPASIEEKLSPKTKALIVMHYGGFPCRMTEIRSWADQNKVALIEDAAHAPGSVYNNVMIGNLGHIGCFSFFANKNMTTGEGGMLTTDSDEIADRVKRLRSHGMSTLTWDRHKGHSFSYDVLETGFNYRMDEIRAAIGRVQIGKLSENNDRRRRVTQEMRSALSSIDGISIPFLDYNLDDSACHLFPIILQHSALRPSFISHSAP